MIILFNNKNLFKYNIIYFGNLHYKCSSMLFYRGVTTRIDNDIPIIYNYISYIGIFKCYVIICFRVSISIIFKLLLISYSYNYFNIIHNVYNGRIDRCL